MGLTGLSRSGKDEAAKVLVQRFGFVKLAFADRLKEGCAAMTGLPLSRFHTGNRDEKMPGFDFSYREFLQLMGTEAVRTVFGEDFWVQVLRQQITMLRRKHGFARFVISDVRFDNEARFLRKHKHPVVKVHRPGLPVMGHASEQGVSRSLITATIDNDSTLKVFRARVAEWGRARGW